jgi:outer membrane protein OmpA-like peptidoglycan-associated protein
MTSKPLISFATIFGTACLLLNAAPARAQQTAPTDTSIDVQLFQPAIGPRNFLTVDAPDVPSHKQLGFGLMLNYQWRPYVIYTRGSNPQTTYVINEQLGAELSASLGLFERVQLGLALPFTGYVKGEMVDGMGAPTYMKFDTNGIGDLRAEVKANFATLGSDDQVSVGGLAGLTVPTGKDSAYLGDRNVTGRIKALAGLEIGHLRAAGNLGVLLRQSSTSFKAEVGHQLLYGGAVSYQVHNRVEAMVEVFGRSGLVEFTKFYWDVNPIEVDAAVRVRLNNMWSLMGGGGMGLGKGIGAPRARGFLGAQFTPDFRDRDQDGVYDINDKCPDQAEDRDNFQDNDGCPDPDNDNDGILDAADKCPNSAEDMDQFQDEDGCPEADNDKDGIDDIHDACPNAAEDGRGKRPKDGCPSTSEDADGDGVADATDKCADEPEDRDGFEDEDGCPELDNDNDGIPDNFDNCPNDAEDPDGFEDEDGCPEPDNDKDGFPDAQDKCPTQPETLNGNKDDDGCPDAGAEIVRLGTNVIEVTERFGFVNRGGQPSLRDSAVHTLGLVALVMKGHPEIKKLRIEVRADGVSKEETQRRADIVRDTLVSKGVDLSRLVSVGMGGGGTRVDFLVEAVTAAPAPKASKSEPEKP